MREKRAANPKRSNKKIVKSSAKSKSDNSSIKLALWALAFLILIILAGKLLTFIASLQKPFSPDILVKKTAEWDGTTSINVAVKSSSILVLNYDPVLQSVVILKIPDQTYFELPKGYGTWQAGSIYALGQEENPPVGAELLKQSMSKLLGLPIDGFITLDDSSLANQPLSQIINQWHNNPLSMVSFLGKVKTDLTPIETVKLITALSGVRPDKITTLNIENSDITDSQLMPDTSRVLGVDNVKLDLFIRQNMEDSTIANENVPVAIFNSTNHPGLAQDASREITNMGGNVVFVSNAQTDLKKTIVITNSQTETAKRLIEIFAPQCAKQHCSSTDPQVQTWQSTITIVLGEDFYQDKYQPN